MRINRRNVVVVTAVAALAAMTTGYALADVKTQAAREAVEYALKKFGKETVEEGTEQFATRVEALAVRHGDEALDAVRKVGPKAVQVIEQAGPKGADAAKLLVRYGDDGAWLARQPEGLVLFSKYGDDAAEAMIKHPGVAEPVIAAYGKPAAAALKEVSEQNGRRLATMTETGELAKIGRGEELLGVVGRFGDRAMEFVWRHKKALAVTAALTAFLANPQPFIDGTRDITEIAFENVAKPLAEVPKELAKGIATGADWTPVLIAIVVVLAVYVTTRLLLKSWERRSAEARQAEQASPRGR